MLDQDTIQAFREDGVVLLRGLFPEWVEPLRRGVDRNMAEPGPYVRQYRTEEGGPLFFGDYCNWERIPEYRDFLFNSEAAAVAGALMGAEQVRLFHEHVLVKEPGTDIATPWHHDQPYYCVDGAQTCSLWLALDPVPRETAIEYVAGSHAWGRWFRPERFDGSALNEDDGLEPVPDIEGHRADYRILGWEMAPGDAVAFNFMILHGAPPNRSEILWRRAFSSRWVGNDARFAVRRGTTSPPFPEVKLDPGARLDHPAFPVVWSRA